jgi:hypothetical protein
MFNGSFRSSRLIPISNKELFKLGGAQQFVATFSGSMSRQCQGANYQVEKCDETWDRVGSEHVCPHATME